MQSVSGGSALVGGSVTVGVRDRLESEDLAVRVEVLAPARPASGGIATEICSGTGGVRGEWDDPALVRIGSPSCCYSVDSAWPHARVGGTAG